MRIESSGFHGSGAARSSRYSNGGAPSAGEPGVDPVGVGVEQRPPLGIGAGVGLFGDVPESMDAILGVDLERAGADERAQLAGGLAALQVHLEEAVLGVDEAECAGHVRTRGAGDRGHAERVACDRDWRRKPGQRAVTLERRQAGAELGARVAAAGDRRERR